MRPVIPDEHNYYTKAVLEAPGPGSYETQEISKAKYLNKKPNMPNVDRFIETKKVAHREWHGD